MKTLFALLFAASMAFSHATEINLSDWSQGFYGVKGSPHWYLDKNKILRQNGKATYAWLVKKSPLFLNGEVSADLIVESGKLDPEAGLVWRHQDGKNYYYVRMNAVENNIIFYRMNKGTKEIVKEVDFKVSMNTWHHMNVKFNNDQVDIFVDNKNVISVRDTVFLKEGRVGFFTTADTVSAFKNFAP